MNLLKRHPLAVAVTAFLLVAVGFLTWRVRVNSARKLSPERLEEARKRWEEKGPQSYTLHYSVLRGGDSTPDRYEVRVQGGKTVAATFNGVEEPEKRWHNYGMGKLFTSIERFLELDAKLPLNQVLHRADFGPDGRLLWYYRQVSGKRESTEITVDSLE